MFDIFNIRFGAPDPGVARDGLASSIMRSFVAEESEDKRWTILDGVPSSTPFEHIMHTPYFSMTTTCRVLGKRPAHQAEGRDKMFVLGDGARSFCKEGTQ
jgi:hypothetical protein